MTRNQFKAHTDERIDDLKKWLQERLGLATPPLVALQFGKDEVVGEGQEAVARLVNHTFVDEDNIYPFVDLCADDWLDDETVLVAVIRSGYKPRPFAKSWTGTMGPYNLFVAENLLPTQL